MSSNKIYICFIILIFILGIGAVSASNDTSITDSNQNMNINYENSQQGISNDNIIDDNKIEKSQDDNYSIKEASNQLNKSNTLNVSLSVVNDTIPLESDYGCEAAIIKNISSTNSMPDVKLFGTDYAYADENGVYTIEGSEIRRVMKLDSYCQQIYGFTPKYTFFRQLGSNVKYIISREKWNVIARSLNSYHVNQGYNSVNTPYSITVNLSGKSRNYCVYYDAQEWINGHQYTCGPTAMSMISQALNCYASERKLSGVYLTTAADGTDEDNIINYSPTVHMKLTDIADNEASVISTLQSGKMVFWHIRGHYMCIIGYNKDNHKFLCLNPSGPSHNINAVQWATWTEVTNTDRKLKENGFMAVSPYWNLTSQDKVYASNYYYNMGGKYTVVSNSEYCNNGLDNKITVTANAPENIIKTTNRTRFIIKCAVGDTFKKSKAVFYLNDEIIGTSSINNGLASLNYTLPAYTPKNVTISARLVNNTQIRIEPEISVSFYKFSAGKTFSNAKAVKLESINIYDVTGKKDDNVTFTAYIYDINGKAVNNGNVVFKLNGITIKENSTPVKIKVAGGIAKYTYTIPAYSAKNYNLTAVFGNNSVRLEDTATLKITKLETKIINITTTKSPDKLVLDALIVDKYGKKVERDTKVTVKIDSRTIIDRYNVVDGKIHMIIDTSVYNIGTHNILIIAGENGVYKSSSNTTTFKLTDADIQQHDTSISNLKMQISNRKLRITGNIIDSNGVQIKSDVKLSVKINSVTVKDKIVIKNGVINQLIDLTKYKNREYTLTLITGSTTHYKSTKTNTKLILS